MRAKPAIVQKTGNALVLLMAVNLPAVLSYRWEKAGCIVLKISLGGYL